MSLGRGDPPASRARPTPAAFGRSGLCRPRRGVGGSGRFLWGWRAELRNRCTPAPETKPGVPRHPVPLGGRGRAQAAAGLFRSPRRAVRLPGSLRRRLWLRAEKASARAPSRGRRGHCGSAARRSFSRPSQPFAGKPGISAACPSPVLFPMPTERLSLSETVEKKGLPEETERGALQPHFKGRFG